jgi:hypothetical protein
VGLRDRAEAGPPGLGAKDNALLTWSRGLGWSDGPGHRAAGGAAAAATGTAPPRAAAAAAAAAAELTVTSPRFNSVLPGGRVRKLRSIPEF